MEAILSAICGMGIGFAVLSVIIVKKATASRAEIQYINHEITRRYHG